MDYMVELLSKKAIANQHDQKIQSIPITGEDSIMSRVVGSCFISFHAPVFSRSQLLGTCIILMCQLLQISCGRIRTGKQSADQLWEKQNWQTDSVGIVTYSAVYPLLLVTREAQIEFRQPSPATDGDHPYPRPALEIGESGVMAAP